MHLKLRQTRLPPLPDDAAKSYRHLRKPLISKGIYQSDTTPARTQFWPLTCTSTLRRTMGRSLPC
jgi:hypothetical protein